MKQFRPGVFFVGRHFYKNYKLLNIWLNVVIIGFLKYTYCELPYSSFPGFLMSDIFLLLYIHLKPYFCMRTNLSAYPHILIYCFYIIFSLNYLLISLSISSLIHVLLNCVLFDFHICGVSLDLLLLNVSGFQFSAMVIREQTLGFQPFCLIGSFYGPEYALCQHNLWGWTEYVFRSWVQFCKYQLGQSGW